MQVINKRLSKRNSPLFSELLSWVKNDDPRALEFFFKNAGFGFLPLKSVEIYEPIKNKGYRILEVCKGDKCFLAIKKDLFDRLFLKPGINVKDEDAPEKHLKDNLYYRTEYFLKLLKKDSGDVNKLLLDFKKDFQKLAPGARFPFENFLNPPQESVFELRKEYEKTTDQLEKILSNFERLFDQGLIPPGKVDSLQSEKYRLERKKEIKEITLKTQILQWEIIRLAESFLKWLSIARGKPGRHPKPFNVLVYHLINRFTSRKIKNGKLSYRKEGLCRLERDWRFILFYLIKFHQIKGFPELNQFINQNKSKPASKVLRLLRKKLWDLYKNFPPKEGWIFQGRLLKTGFRKLIVDEGRLKIIYL